MGATTTLKAYNCPNCNAPLSVAVEAESVKCQYCGHTFELRRHKPAPQPQPPPQPPIVQQVIVSRSPPPSRSPLRWLGLMPISIIALVAYFVARKPDVISTVTSTVTSTMTGGAIGGMQWDAVASGPLLVDVDGDGYEDFIGRGRKISPDELWVAAFAGATLAPKWKVGPLGDWNARDAVKFAVAGKRVLITDGRHTARVVDLHSGQQLAAIALSDKPSDVCAEPGGARFFVATADGEQLFIAGEPPARSDGKRPSWCPKSGPFANMSPGMRAKFNRDEGRAPKVPGFHSSYVLSDGTRAVAVGEKHPGTAIAMLAGFAVGRNAVDWSRQIPPDPAEVKDGAPDVAALGHGTVYAYYALTSLRGGRLAAFDAASGTPRWDVLVPHSATGSAPEQLVVGAQRVYVPHWSWLDVLDAKSGAVVGTIGN